MTLTELPPLQVSDRFRPLGRQLLSLLESLDDEAWHAPTVCSSWTVRDLVAHLVDTGYRRLSTARDGMRPPPPATPIESYADLLSLLDTLNREWVDAARRLSPRIVLELIRDQEPRFCDWVETADLDGDWAFPVAWAGDERPEPWFDIARELTERWLHQQQIRLAVGAPALDDPWTSRPIFDTFAHALPHTYRAVDAAEGRRLELRIEGRELYAYRLLRGQGTWHLGLGETTPWASADARVVMPERFAWRLFTSRRVGREAAENEPAVRVEGDERLAAPLFDSIAVMA
ncbi:MAG: maleylpyruvate isomerase N-terminal domain-containing protein [Acidobacteriota bacterium]